jgi:hypothetical protein
MFPFSFGFKNGEAGATKYPASAGRLISTTAKLTHQERYTCMEYRMKVLARQHWRTGNLYAAIEWATDTARENNTHCQIYDNAMRETIFKIGPRTRQQL